MYSGRHDTKEKTKADKNKKKFKNWLQRSGGGLSGKRKYLKWVILLAVLALLALGIYWQDLHLVIPDWFSAFKGLIPDWFSALKSFFVST